MVQSDHTTRSISTETRPGSPAQWHRHDGLVPLPEIRAARMSGRLETSFAKEITV
jgi:hypothetical protein